MNLIAAVDKNWAIGKDNKLLVSIPMDMKFFRETTTGKVVVMGRKTLESFPNGLPLKNRTNIVLTANREFAREGVTVVHSIEEMLDYKAWYLGHWHINKRIDKLHFLMHDVEMMID